MLGFDVQEYNRSGLASVSMALSQSDVEEINARLDSYLKVADYGVVAEGDVSIPRAVHGLHLVEPFFKELCERPALLDAVETALQGEVYVHQFKINLKIARVGESWPWHQDFIFWKELDGISRADLVNVAIYLSDAGEKTGPLQYFPGSHLWGDICRRSQKAQGDNDWTSDVGKDLTFQACPKELLARAANTPPAIAIRTAGDVDFFHPQLVHGSELNVSDRDRRLLIITYNLTSNLPKLNGHSRPEFLCSRRFSPLRPYKTA